MWTMELMLKYCILLLTFSVPNKKLLFICIYKVKKTEEALLLKQFIYLYIMFYYF